MERGKDEQQIFGDLLVLADCWNCFRSRGARHRVQRGSGCGQAHDAFIEDFEPRPMVHLAVHAVPHAKFPVVDIHNHVNDAQGNNGENVPLAEVVANMDRANVKTIVILTGLWGEQLQAVLDTSQAISRPFCSIYANGLAQDWRPQVQREDGATVG